MQSISSLRCGRLARARLTDSPLPQAHLTLFLPHFPFSLTLSSSGLPSLAATTGRAAARFVTSSPSHLPATSIYQDFGGQSNEIKCCSKASLSWSQPLASCCRCYRCLCTFFLQIIQLGALQSTTCIWMMSFHLDRGLAHGDCGAHCANSITCILLQNLAKHMLLPLSIMVLFMQRYMVALRRYSLQLLNATLVIPEIQATTRAKGISPKFKSFSYLYDEDHFIDALSNDVAIVRGLPKDLREARKKIKFPTVSPRNSATPEFYMTEVLPRLVKSKVIGIIVNGGNCLKSILPGNLEEFQKLRCRVAFHALRLRPQIQALGSQIVGRLRASGRPYLAYHPGLLRDTLAFHGCAELFQDIHTELIQSRRNQMIKRGTVKEQLTVDSVSRKMAGLCPLMPEEVGLLLQALGYPPTTIIFLAGSEIFGGQRMLIPLRAMFANLVDRTSLCSQKELSDLVGPEDPLTSDLPHPPPPKSEKELIEEWKRAGPRPRPLPPPPARPFYAHEKEGWYGWIGENDTEPDASPIEFRRQAHRLLWDALDYFVSVEADAFFPGFHNDGSGWPDYSSLIMGHRLYQTPSGITYRPDRKIVAALFEDVSDHQYHPPRNWTIAAREHLNRSAGVEGVVSSATLSRPVSFLAHPLPECSCRTPKSPAVQPVKGSNGRLLFGGEEECPDWMVRSLTMVSTKNSEPQNEDYEDELPEDDSSLDMQHESDRSDGNKSSEQDEEMDPDD